MIAYSNVVVLSDANRSYTWDCGSVGRLVGRSVGRWVGGLGASVGRSVGARG